MPVVNGYLTEQELRDQFRDNPPELLAPLVHKAINATSRAIDRHVNGGPVIHRRFWQDAQPVARVFRVDEPLVAWVDDISTKQDLVVATDPGLDGTFGKVWDPSEYQLEPLNQDVAAVGDTATAYAWWRIVAVGSRQFPVHPQRATLKVTARFGWSAIPDDVNKAATLKSAKLFKRSDSPDGFARGLADFGIVRISRFEDPDVADLLQPFLWDVAF